MCVQRLWGVCKQFDHTGIHLHTAGMHSWQTLQSPLMFPMSDGRSESGDGWHQRASLHLCHSANPPLLSSITSPCLSPDTPSKPSSHSVRQSLTLSLLRLPTFLHGNHHFLAAFHSLALRCLVSLKKNKKKWKFVLCFWFCFDILHRLSCVTWGGGRSAHILT